MFHGIISARTETSGFSAVKASTISTMVAPSLPVKRSSRSKPTPVPALSDDGSQLDFSSDPSGFNNFSFTFHGPVRRGWSAGGKHKRQN